MSAFPPSPYDGEVYTIGPRSWTWSAAQQGWLLNFAGSTGPTGVTGPVGTPGVLLTSLTVDSFTGDGVTNVFTLSITPQNAYNTLINIDGLVQTPNVNYTISGTQLTFSAAPIDNASVDVVIFMTGSPVTGSVGSTGPTGAASSTTGPTGPTGNLTGPTGSIGSTGAIGPVGPTGPGYGRVTASVATPSIAPGSNSLVTASGFKGYGLYSLQVSAPAWVTIYSSVASETADLSRSMGVDPTPGSGVIAEVITDNPQTVLFTPFVNGWSSESPPTSDIPMKVYNNGISSNVITTTLTLLQLES